MDFARANLQTRSRDFTTISPSESATGFTGTKRSVSSLLDRTFIGTSTLIIQTAEATFGHLTPTQPEYLWSETGRPTLAVIPAIVLRTELARSSGVQFSSG